MIKKLRILNISIFLITVILVFSGFKHYYPNPFKHPVNPNAPDSPIDVFLQVSGNVITMLNSSEESIISAIGEASRLWSMFSTNSNLNITFFGKNQRYIPISFDEISCEEEDFNDIESIVRRHLENNNNNHEVIVKNEIIATGQDDPDCTGPACTHLWICEDKNEIANFDIQLNLANFDIRSENINNNVYDLKTLIAHHLGHAIGMSHCSAGDTIDSCNAKLSEGMSDPPEDSMMYKLLLHGQVKTDISNDDRNGLVALYGELTPERAALQVEMQEFLDDVEEGCPCLLPEDETVPKYMISTEENDALVEYETTLNENNLNTVEKRKEYSHYYQKLHLRAYSKLSMPAERYLLSALNNMNDYLEIIPIERLTAMRQVIVCNIDEKKYISNNFQYELDPRFYKFTQAELKLMIQIRKSIIDEILSRN